MHIQFAIPMLQHRVTSVIKLWIEAYKITCVATLTHIKTSEPAYVLTKLEFSDIETYTVFALTWDSFLASVDSNNVPGAFFIKHYVIYED